jgi:hypothetical protein
LPPKSIYINKTYKILNKIYIRQYGDVISIQKHLQKHIQQNHIVTWLKVKTRIRIADKLYFFLTDISAQGVEGFDGAIFQVLTVIIMLVISIVFFAFIYLFIYLFIYIFIYLFIYFWLLEFFLVSQTGSRFYVFFFVFGTSSSST